jgi:hypothetical protein
VLDHVGFTDVRWGREVDVFSGSAHESDAKDFDTRGHVQSIKPQSVSLVVSLIEPSQLTMKGDTK